MGRRNESREYKLAAEQGPFCWDCGNYYQEVSFIDRAGPVGRGLEADF